MDGAVKIEGGFAEVGAGAWLMGRAQPAAFFGAAVRRRRKGWIVRDRGRLDLVETNGAAKCADAVRPFLTYIPCAEPIFAVSDKVLVAPMSARKDAHIVKAIPMSAKGSLCATEFGERGTGNGEPGGKWVVMATAGRTARVPVSDGETFSARSEAVVAWTGRLPTGFCPKLSIWDILLPRGPRDLLFTFYGPSIVWIEGSVDGRPSAFNSQLANRRRAYGV
jgi:hypothetical protein